MLHSLDKGDQIKDLRLGLDLNGNTNTNSSSSSTSASSTSSSSAGSAGAGVINNQQQEEHAGEQQQLEEPQPQGSLWQKHHRFVSRGMSLAPSGLGQPVMVVNQEVRWGGELLTSACTIHSFQQRVQQIISQG